MVIGEGLVNAVPDRAWITIGAESRAPSPREAQRRNTELMRPVQEKLRAAGIPADAIRTTGYDVQYEWDFVNGKRVGRGYVARNTIEVRIDTIDRVGEYLEIAVGSGATSLNGIRFDMKDQAKLEREALRMAVADARVRRREAAAAGAGRTIDRILADRRAGRRLTAGADALHARGCADRGGRRRAADCGRPDGDSCPGQCDCRLEVKLKRPGRIQLAFGDGVDRLRPRPTRADAS